MPVATWIRFKDLGPSPDLLTPLPPELQVLMSVVVLEEAIIRIIEYGQTLAYCALQINLGNGT